MRLTRLPVVVLVLSLAGAGLASPAAAHGTSHRLRAPVGTGAVHKQRPLSGVAPLPRLVSVRTGRHRGYDRVVFEFAGSLPASESVRYVRRVVADGSGAVVPLRGRAFLQVGFGGASAHTDAGQLSFPQPRRISPRWPALRQVALASDFEGHVDFGLGLRRRVGFRVFELTRPPRVVVDVAHGPARR